MKPGGVLALDLSLTTGWAFGSPDETPICGIWKLPRFIPGAAYNELQRVLTDACAALRPGLLFVEAPIMDYTQDSHRLLLGLSAHVDSLGQQLSIPVREEHVGTIRVRTIGTCRFPKETPNQSGSQAAKAGVYKWCRAQGWSPPDDNAADALVCWKYACNDPKTRHLIAVQRELKAA